MYRLKSRCAKQIYLRSLIIIALSLLTNLLMALYSFKIRDMINHVSQSDINLIWKDLALFLLMFVLVIAVNGCNDKAKRWAEYENTFSLRSEFLDHLYSIPMYCLNEYGRNNISNRYTEEMERIVSFYVYALPDIVKNFTFFVFVALYALSENVIIFCVILCMVPVVFFLSKPNGEKISYYSTQTAEKDVVRNTEEYDILASHMELKCYGAAEFCKDKVAECEEKYRVNNLGLVRGYRFAWGMEVFAFIIVKYAVLVIGALFAFSGHLSFGMITSLIVILDPIVSSIFSFSSMFSTLTGIKPIIARYTEWQDVKEESVKDDVRGGAGADKQMLFTLRNVSFRYKSEETDLCVLKNVNIELEAGKKYLLIGKNGTGKSTLLRILAGCDNRYEGSVLYEGNEISQIDNQELREQIIFLTDQMYLVAGTIRDIFGMLYSEITDADIIKYLKFVELPFSADMYIDKDACNISGGEKQRLGLALLMASERKILIMDECLSMVSIEQQLRIMKRLFAKRDITCIWIDHRVLPEIFEMFDRMMFIENNHISCGAYAEMIQNDLFLKFVTEKNLNR